MAEGAVEAARTVGEQHRAFTTGTLQGLVSFPAGRGLIAALLELVGKHQQHPGVQPAGQAVVRLAGHGALDGLEGDPQKDGGVVPLGAWRGHGGRLGEKLLTRIIINNRQ